MVNFRLCRLTISKLMFVVLRDNKRQNYRKLLCYLLIKQCFWQGASKKMLEKARRNRKAMLPD